MKPQDLHTLALAALTAPQPLRYNDTGEPAQPAAVTAAAALAAKVDRLGAIQAAAATLKKEADQIRADLEDAGLADIEGQLFRVNFAQCAARATTDWQAIAQRLKASPQLIRAYTKTGEASTRMTRERAAALIRAWRRNTRKKTNGGPWTLKRSGLHSFTVSAPGYPAEFHTITWSDK